jgi:Ca2+-binding RTX toxin-like protein
MISFVVPPQGITFNYLVQYFRACLGNIKMKKSQQTISYLGGILVTSLFSSPVIAKDWHVSNFIDLNNAVKTAENGDVVYIASGNYKSTDNSAYVDDLKVYKDLRFIGDANNRPVFNATGARISKGVFSIGQNKAIFENIVFQGAGNTDRNGAGIRATSYGELTVKNCLFKNNNNGVLVDHAHKNVKIYDSEFIGNGEGDGYSHGVYLHSERILVENSIFRDTKVGNQVKTLGYYSTIIRNNIIDDGVGNPSRAIDMTGGGDILIEGNTITRTANADNPRLMYYSAGRTDREAGDSLIIRNNTIYNSHPNAMLSVNATEKPITLENNTITNTNGGVIALSSGLTNTNNNSIDGTLLANTHYKDDSILGSESDDIEDIDTPYLKEQKYNFLAGNDTIKTSAGIETIFAGKGHDTIQSGGGRDSVHGEDGDDIIFGEGGANTPGMLTGGAGNDVIISGEQADYVLGGSGNDILYAVSGYNNNLSGHGGDDIIIGGTNTDYRLNGGDGDDFLDGREGNEKLHGGKGNDILIGGPGSEQKIYGGPGIDTSIVAGNYEDYILVEGNSWDEQPTTKITRPATALEGSPQWTEIGKWGEHHQSTEFIQFDNGVYDASNRTFAAGVQRIDLAPYAAVRKVPSSPEEVVFFFGSNHPLSNKANNEPTMFTLTYTAEVGGRITGTATQTVNENASGTAVTAVADNGYTFSEWSDGSKTATRTDTNINQGLNLTAYFTRDQDNPPFPDYDNDGIPDSTDTDDDNDGFSDADEILAGTDPLDATDKPDNSDSEKESEADSGGSIHPAGLLLLGILILVQRREKYKISISLSGKKHNVL